jgi:hypothetical protein
MTRTQFDAAIKRLLDEAKKYTDAASPTGDESAYIINMVSSMVLAGIAGALIEARNTAPPEPRFYKNDEEEDG